MPKPATRCCCDPSQDRCPAAAAPLTATLAVLAAADVGLVFGLADALGTLLLRRDAPVFPAMAAAGCTAMIGAALALTWLNLQDLIAVLRKEPF